MELEEALTIELSAIVGLAGKVFPIVAVQGTLYPYLVYSLGSTTLTDTLVETEVLNQSQYQLDYYHASYSGLKALKKLVLSNLKTYSLRVIGGTGPYVQQLEIVNSFETFEDSIKLYKGIIEFDVYFTE